MTPKHNLIGYQTWHDWSSNIWSLADRNANFPNRLREYFLALGSLLLTCVDIVEIDTSPQPPKLLNWDFILLREVDPLLSTRVSNNIESASDSLLAVRRCVLGAGSMLPLSRFSLTYLETVKGWIRSLLPTSRIGNSAANYMTSFLKSLYRGNPGLKFRSIWFWWTFWLALSAKKFALRSAKLQMFDDQSCHVWYPIRSCFSVTCSRLDASDGIIMIKKINKLSRWPIFTTETDRRKHHEQSRFILFYVCPIQVSLASICLLFSST